MKKFGKKELNPIIVGTVSIINGIILIGMVLSERGCKKCITTKSSGRYLWDSTYDMDVSDLLAYGISKGTSEEVVGEIARLYSEAIKEKKK